MKVLFLINNFSGLLSFRKEVVSAISAAGNEVLISGPMSDSALVLKDLGVKLIDTPFNRKGTNPLKDMLLIRSYIKLLRREKPDIVLTYTIKPNLYGGIACRICGISQVANITGLGSAVENPGWLQIITITMYKWCMKKTRTVFFQNRANLSFCLQHKMVKEKCTRLIPGSGVNLQHHYYQEYPSSNEPFRFIFISRLMREKGVEEYLKAAIEIKKRYPNTEFHILGAPEENYITYIEQLQREGIIIYHGMQPDVRTYIGKAHCTIHPSFYPEGMSNVLLESCAAGRPIITTNRPGCKEIVDDGINGFVVEQRNSNDLIEKIETFINIPYERKREMGIASRRKVEKEFDRNIVVKAYLDEIERFKHV